MANVVPLKDLCLIDITDGTHQTPTYVDDGYIFLSSKNVTSGVIDWENVMYIPESLHSDLYKRIAPQKNDILLAKNGTTGVAAIVDRDEIFDIYVSLALIRPDPEKVLPKYLLHAINSDTTKRFFNSHLKGIGVPNLHLTHIRETPINVPSFSEQKDIINLLGKVGKVISLRKQQIAKLDELVKARFVEMFGDINSKIQRYPVVKIGSCAKLQGGFAFKSSDYIDDGIRLVQISNVNKDTLDWDSINCVPQAFLQKYKDFELHVGDLILAMTRPVIKSLDAVKIATVSENDVPSLLNQRVGRFIIDEAKLNPLYLMLSCQMPEFREYVEAMSGNSLQPNISSKQVEEYSIVLPPLALQEEFAAFVAQTDKQKLTIQHSLDKLELMKKALMQKYFG